MKCFILDYAKHSVSLVGGGAVIINGFTAMNLVVFTDSSVD